MSCSSLHRQIYQCMSQVTAQDICCIRRSPAASQEDEEADESNSLSKHGRELQRLLKTTGLSESDDDPSNEVRSVLLQISNFMSALCVQHAWASAWQIQWQGTCYYSLILTQTPRLYTCAWLWLWLWLNTIVVWVCKRHLSCTLDRLSNNAKVFFRMQKGHNVRSSLHDILGGDLFASPRILERCPMESLIKVVEVWVQKCLGAGLKHFCFVEFTWHESGL